jgi:hypothetical protein
MLALCMSALQDERNSTTTANSDGLSPVPDQCTKRSQRAPLTDAHRQQLMKPRKPPLADAAQQALRERKRVYNRHYRERRRQRQGATMIGEPSWVACLACRSVFRNMPCYRRAHERGVRHQGRLALMDQQLPSPRDLFVEWKAPQ